MTPLQKRLAIAKAHGWSELTVLESKSAGGLEDVLGINLNYDAGGFLCEVPDYLNDLNEVAKVRADLLTTLPYQSAYCIFLSRVCGADLSSSSTGLSRAEKWWKLADASAEQHIEAILLTLNIP